jgi:hypothetical protein
MEYCIGIDIGGTKIKIGLFAVINRLSCHISLLDDECLPTKDNVGSLARFMVKISNCIKRLCESRQISATDICSIGIGIPGDTDYAEPQNPKVTRSNPNLYFMVGLSVEEMRKYLVKNIGLDDKISVSLYNDVIAASIAEIKMGSLLNNKERAGVVIIGTAIGCSLVDEKGEIFEKEKSIREMSTFAVPDEYGRFPEGPEDKHYYDCPCMGPLTNKIKVLLNSKISSSSCPDWLKRQFPSEESVNKIDSNYGVKFVECLKSEISNPEYGDFFISIFQDFREYLIQGVIRLCNKHAITKISIGGGLFDSEDSLFFEPIRESLEKSGIQLVKALRNSGIYGNALASLELSNTSFSGSQDFPGLVI